MHQIIVVLVARLKYIITYRFIQELGREARNNSKLRWKLKSLLHKRSSEEGTLDYWQLVWVLRIQDHFFLFYSPQYFFSIFKLASCSEISGLPSKTPVLKQRSRRMKKNSPKELTLSVYPSQGEHSWTFLSAPSAYIYLFGQLYLWSSLYSLRVR